MPRWRWNGCARKSASELSLLKEASERVVAAMQATFSACRPGMTKHDVVAHLRREETNRGLNFEYCLISAGAESPNRAPSDQLLGAGDIISLDSGAELSRLYRRSLPHGECLGEPDPSSRTCSTRSRGHPAGGAQANQRGGSGRDIYERPNRHARPPQPTAAFHFPAHGMGLVTMRPRA